MINKVWINPNRTALIVHTADEKLIAFDLRSDPPKVSEVDGFELAKWTALAESE